MIWFLIMCTRVYGGVQCQPPQPMPSQIACQFIGKHIKSASIERGYVSEPAAVRCVGVKR